MSISMTLDVKKNVIWQHTLKKYLGFIDEILSKLTTVILHVPLVI